LEKTPAEIREELEVQQAIVRAFRALLARGPNDPVSHMHAGEIIWGVVENSGATFDEEAFESALGLPEDTRRIGWEPWKGWTKQLVLDGVAFVARTSGSEEFQDSPAEEVCRVCAARAEMNVFATKRALVLAEAILQRAVRSRLLLPAERLEKVARYESHLERSLHKTLHEIQRLHALRAGDSRA